MCVNRLLFKHIYFRSIKRTYANVDIFIYVYY